MSYCPECGEQVAKIDVFCPFCGIGLKPVSDAEDPFSKTIVELPAPVSNWVQKEPVAAPQTEEKPAEKSSQLAEFPASDAAPETRAPFQEEKKSFGYSTGDTSENWTMKTESVEVPADVFKESGVPLEDVFKTPENVERQKYFDDPVEMPPASDIPTPAINQDSGYGFDDPFGQKPEDFKSVSEQSEFERPESGRNFSPPIKDDSSFEPMPAKTPAPENLSGYNDPVSENLFESKQHENNDFLSEPPVNYQPSFPPEPPIAMPDAPLETDVHEEAARFDSVQIIQKDEIKEESYHQYEQKPFVQEGGQAARQEPSSTRQPVAASTGGGDTDGRKAAKLKPLDEGTVLNGRYEIVRKIGGGGMGAVYLANDRNLGGVLRAVKEMVQSYIESDQQDKAVSDFKRESLLLTSLDHPAIPTIYDYFFDEKEGRFYLVMKYISGGDLASRLRGAPEGRLDEKTVTEWAIQIADVLNYLHNHEPVIVYRDLKPANVMIDGNSGRVMLIDFGIARWVNKEEKGVTAVGTMGYAPPELFSGNVEPRSDIYSLGSTMFHLLTGADPQSNPLLIFDFQKNPRPRQINSQLSDQIERILMRSVEYNIEARFTSAAEMREELQEHLNNLKAGRVSFGVKAAPSSPAFSEQSVFCGFCGKQIVATDLFCAFCGAQQPIAQQSFSQSNFIQPVVPKLMIVGTNELDSTSFKLEKNENLIGRRDPMSNIFPEIDLSKFDPQTKISRRHARIWREGNSFLVEDLGSSNGTTLLPTMSDSIRLLPHQPHTLTNGDRIRVGDTTLHFTVS